MTSLSPISRGELERRWTAVRRAMAAEDLDALVVQGADDWLGGAVRWLTDVPATNGYPRTVVVHRDRPMTVIEMGPFGGARDLAEENPLHPGVGRIVTTPSFFSVGYTNGYDAELVVAELARVGAARIGLFAPGALPFALVDALRRRYEDREAIVDASDLLDRLKAVKSPEEQALIRRVAALQDEVFASVLDVVRPGLRDIDVANHAQATAHRLGSDQGILLGVSAPVGRPSRFLGRHFQGRTLETGDHLSLLIEVNGPGGLYLEIARTIVLGKAPPPLLDAFEAVRDAQAHTLSLIRPGARPAEIAAAHDAWMTARGLPAETRLYAHGQGTDMVERPLIRHDETMDLSEGMCLAVHPGYDDGTVFAVICDNYLVGPDGPGACLHRTEKRIFEV